MAGTTRSDGAEFPEMGTRVEDGAVAALEWCGAPPTAIATASGIIASLERDEYGDIPFDEHRMTRGRHNDAAFDRLIDLVGPWLNEVDLTVKYYRDADAWGPGHLISPSFDGMVPDPSETAFTYRVNDHGNVTVFDGGRVLWSFV